MLAWIRSYLIGRSQRVSFDGERSTITPLICGLAQGSVLGPLYFLLYIYFVCYSLPSARHNKAVIVRQGNSAASSCTRLQSSGSSRRAVSTYTHRADDLQIYAHGDPLRSASMVNRLSDCVDVVKGWMASNRLRLNHTKTEVILLGSRSCLKHCPKSHLLISGALITPSSQVRNLGVVMDSDFSMTAHVNNLVRVCSFHLRQLRLIRRSLGFGAAHRRTHSFGRSYIVVWTIVTASSQECRIICSDDYRQSWTRVLVFSSSCLVVRVYQSGCATSCIGYVSHSGSHTNCACWRSRRSTIRLRSTWCDVAFGFHPTRVELVWGQPPPVNSSKKTFGDRAFASSGPISWNITVCPV